MSAVNPLSPPSQSGAGPASEKRVYEPSMEEILASIRRIIADDQSLPGRGAVVESLSVETRDSRESNLAPPPVSAPEPVPASAAQHRIDMPVTAPDETIPAASAPSAPPEARLHATEPVPADHVHASEERAVHSFEPPASGDLPLSIDPSHVLADEAPASGVAERLSGPVPLDATRAHGSIAAPQFAMPDGPINDDARSEQAAAPVPPLTTPLPEAPDADRDEDFSLYETAIEPAAPAAPSRLGKADGGAGLFSAATDSSVSSAFNMLAASRLADNSDELMTLAREMIRPLLRTWVDDNLPSMVERMVRAEIERVARGGR